MNTMKEKTLEAYRRGDYLRVLQIMASNPGNGGDVEKMLDDFAANADYVEEYDKEAGK